MLEILVFKQFLVNFAKVIEGIISNTVIPFAEI